MTSKDYPHNDTSVSERTSRTAGLNKPYIPQGVRRLRDGAFAREIPVSSDETLAFLCICAKMAKPMRILEIGTAIGVSGICLLDSCPKAHLTTIELNGQFADEAEENFKNARVWDRVALIRGDAAEVLPKLEGGFDFIFLDGPKVQYIKYLPVLKGLLNAGGTLFADDVLLYGWVNGENPVPPKRRMLVKHIREYIDAVTSDEELATAIVDVGDGVALSVRCV